MKTSAKLVPVVVPEPTPTHYVKMTLSVDVAQDLFKLLNTLRNRKGDSGGDDEYVSTVLKDLGYDIDEDGYFTPTPKNLRLFAAGLVASSMETILREALHQVPKT